MCPHINSKEELGIQSNQRPAPWSETKMVLHENEGIENDIKRYLNAKKK
jgi:hypothetical protein